MESRRHSAPFRRADGHPRPRRPDHGGDRGRGSRAPPRLLAPRTASPAHDLLARCLGADRLATLDAFDRVQLEHVIEIVRRTRSLSEAGRQLFGASRRQKATANDADRLRKYLARFGLDWKTVRDEGAAPPA